MAKIPLRSYFREIERLIERGMNEEATAHCRFILKYYPKSIETYRLLSKAFLESQRYSEAADILQRILSVSPDDFFALIGMSITREDEGNLDAAIFFMERAYETQPANVAVQDELRRLYGRRDGVEPPKLRLSRGALVRMYYKGGLNRQAVAEINAAIKEDAKRTDLEVILAKIFMDLGEKIQAFEVAARILSQLPYCYEAIQVLVNILPTTAHSKDTQMYLDRLVSLDPYISFLSSSCPTVQQVPDNAVVIDRLDWHPTETTQQPAWAQTVGVSVEQEPSEKTPEWLVEEPSSTDEIPEVILNGSIIEPESVVESDVEPSSDVSGSVIPDWMQEAGWAVSDGTSIDSIQPIPPIEEDSDEATKAELPEWLREIAPADIEPVEETSPDEQVKMDLLNQILPPSESENTSISEEVSGLPINFVDQTADIQDISDSQVEASDLASDLLLSQPEISQTAEDISRIIPSQELIQEGTIEEQKLIVGEIIEEPLSVDTILPIEMDGLSEMLPSVEAETPSISEEAVENSVDLIEPVSEIPEVHDLQEKGSDLLGENSTQLSEDELLVVDSSDSITTPPLSLAEFGSLEGQKDTVDEITDEPLPDWIRELSSLEEPDLNTTLEIAEEVQQTTSESPLSEAFQPTSEELETSETSLLAEPELGTSENELPGVAQEAELPAPTELADEITQTNEPVETNVEEFVSQTNKLQENFAEVESAPDLLGSASAPVASQDNVIIPDLTDTDAAMAWLESLAARQGAAEETLTTTPEERLENPPDWIQALTGSSSETVPEVQDSTIPPSVEELVIDQQLTDELPVINIDALIPDPVVSTESFPELETEPGNLESIASIGEEKLEKVPSQAPGEMDFESAFAWMESLAAQQGASEETLITPLEERPTIAPLFIAEELSPEEASSPTQPVKITANESIEDSENQAVDIQPEINLPDWESPTAVPPSDVSKPIVKTIENETEQNETPQEEIEAAPISLISPEPKNTSELGPLPDWLKGIASEPESEVPPAASSQPSELPDWLKGLEGIVENQPQAQPVTEPPDWVNEQMNQPAPPSETQSESDQTPEWIHGIDDAGDVKSKNESESALPQEELEKFDALETIPAGTETPQLLLNAAQTALSGGKIEISMRYYSRLIQNKSMIEETIHDLRDALYRYPVDISIWQTLGDAYLRNNQIQDALDAYTKAEEFLR